MRHSQSYSVISFINGAIAASGIVLAVLMYVGFIPIARYAKEIAGTLRVESSFVTEEQILMVFYLGIAASVVAVTYEVYRWVKGRNL